MIETYRYRFACTRTLPKKKYFAIKSIVQNNGGHTGSFGKYWSFTIPSSSYDTVLYLLRQIVPDIHTLPEHLDNIRHYFNLKPKVLGHYCFTIMPKGEGWQWLDTSSRLWIQLDTFQSGTSTVANIRAGCIIRCFEQGIMKFYKVNDAGTQLHPLSTRRAGGNLAALYFSTKKAYWVDHGSQWVIPIHLLGEVPQDIFLALARMRPLAEVFSGLLVFSKEDFDVIREFLKVIRVELVQCSRLVQLKGDESKKSGTPLLSLSDVGPAKVASLRSLFAAMGIEVSVEMDIMRITSTADSFNIAFTAGEKPIFQDDTLYLPTTTIEDVRSFREVAKSILKRLRNLEVPLNRLLALTWNPTNQADESFVIEVFLQNIDDTAFVDSLLASKYKLAIIRKWYEDTMQNVDFSMLDKLRKVSKHLARHSAS